MGKSEQKCKINKCTKLKYIKDINSCIYNSKSHWPYLEDARKTIPYFEE